MTFLSALLSHDQASLQSMALDQEIDMGVAARVLCSGGWQEKMSHPCRSALFNPCRTCVAGKVRRTLPF
jgi:hypothetical protein